MELIDTGWLDAKSNKWNPNSVRQIDGSLPSVTCTQSQTQHLATLEYLGKVLLTDVRFPILFPKSFATVTERLLT